MSDRKVTKKCAYCQLEIPKKAKICPNCRKKQRASFGTLFGRAVLYLVAIFCFFYLVGSCSSSENVNTGNTEANSNQPDISQSQFTVGDVVETKELKVTLISANEVASDNQYVQPKDGDVFWQFEFEFENISETEQHISVYNFSCYANGYNSEQIWINDEDISATLSTGKKTKGKVYFEIPVDTNELEISYLPALDDVNKISYVVK